MREFVLQVKVDRRLAFRFKTLAYSHGLSLSRAVEELMRAALGRAGVEVPIADEREGS